MPFESGQNTAAIDIAVIYGVDVPTLIHNVVTPAVIDVAPEVIYVVADHTVISIAVVTALIDIHFFFIAVDAPAVTVAVALNVIDVVFRQVEPQSRQEGREQQHQHPRDQHPQGDKQTLM